MRLRNVLDVDVIAHRGAIGSRPVGAGDLDFRQLAGGNACKLRDETGRATARRLAEHSGRVRTRRIEAAKDGDPPIRVRARKIAQKILDDALGPAIDVLRHGRRVFGHRERRRLTVHRPR